MWSHSYGKLLRCLLIVILFQMFSGDPDAAGAAVVCTGSFNLLTAIKLQSHSDKSVYLGGGTPNWKHLFPLFLHSELKNAAI